MGEDASSMARGTQRRRPTSATVQTTQGRALATHGRAQALPATMKTLRCRAVVAQPPLCACTSRPPYAPPHLRWGRCGACRDASEWPACGKPAGGHSGEQSMRSHEDQAELSHGRVCVPQRRGPGQDWLAHQPGHGAQPVVLLGATGRCRHNPQHWRTLPTHTQGISSCGSSPTCPCVRADQQQRAHPDRWGSNRLSRPKLQLHTRRRRSSKGCSRMPRHAGALQPARHQAPCLRNPLQRHPLWSLPLRAVQPRPARHVARTARPPSCPAIAVAAASASLPEHRAWPHLLDDIVRHVLPGRQAEHVVRRRPPSTPVRIHGGAALLWLRVGVWLRGWSR